MAPAGRGLGRLGLIRRDRGEPRAKRRTSPEDARPAPPPANRSVEERPRIAARLASELAEGRSAHQKGDDAAGAMSGPPVLSPLHGV